MGTFFEKLRLITSDPTLRNKILFVLGALVLFRVLATIPIPGVNVAQLEAFFSQNQFLGLMNIFSGGGLSNLSIVMLGVGPYITASIIMQLLTIMSPRLKAMYQEEGEAGRKKFTQYSRILTVPLAFIQAFGFLILLSRQGIVTNLDLFTFITNVTVIAAGSIFLMWIGELITEFGIGNGISLLIFAGIVASLPTIAGQLFFSFDQSQIPLYLGFAVAAMVVTAAVVVMTEAERPVPITYAKQQRGERTYGGVSTYLPLRVNQAGVIPIIFALSILLFPQMILNFIVTFGTDFPTATAVAQRMIGWLANTWIYAVLYFALVFLFTYFYTAITFEPNTIATNLQKNGAFVPGVRPGSATATYLGNIVTRITLIGALFLGGIAVLPILMQAITGASALAIGGTALLIVVSVILDLLRKIDAQITMREY
jgi:preprotein translocase subunit SecY